MRAGVSGNVAALPVRRPARGYDGATSAVAVVLALVAENFAKLFQPASFLDQHHPVVMPALVAEMAEQRAIGFAELLALPLSLDGIRFHDVDRDDAVEMAGQCVAHEIEGQRPLPSTPAVERQAEAEERIDEALLGPLQLPPGKEAAVFAIGSGSGG